MSPANRVFVGHASDRCAMPFDEMDIPVKHRFVTSGVPERGGSCGSAGTGGSTGDGTFAGGEFVFSLANTMNTARKAAAAKRWKADILRRAERIVSNTPSASILRHSHARDTTASNATSATSSDFAIASASSSIKLQASIFQTPLLFAHSGRDYTKRRFGASSGNGRLIK